MRNLTDFAIQQEYEQVKELGDQLVEVGNRINWEAFDRSSSCYLITRAIEVVDQISTKS